MTKLEILIIDDEVPIRKLLEITLVNNNYKVNQAATGGEGKVQAANHPPDLILLDIGLPDESGLSVLKQIREWYSKPIIMLSVQKEEQVIVQALDAGANDYLTKPFRIGELLARIRTNLRNNTSENKSSTIACKELEIDLVARTVKKNQQLLKLTGTEYNLLVLLAKNEGRVLTHQYLLREIWGPGYLEQSQYLRVFIAQLRKKLENNPNIPELIKTESGVGYRFACGESL